MPLTPSTPVTLLVQKLLSKVCAVTDSVAVPGALGLPVTVAVNWEDVQVTPLVPVALERNAAEVPEASGAVRVSCGRDGGAARAAGGEDGAAVGGGGCGDREGECGGGAA